MKIDKERLKKNAINIGLDAAAILACGAASAALPQVLPALKGTEIFIAVASGIWLYLPLKSLISKLRK